MKIRLSTKKVDQCAESKLKEYYDLGLIVPEKKPFFSRHQNSVGPFLAVSEDEFIFDTASQIASIGLGFNAGALFGVGHHLESWLNLHGTQVGEGIKTAFSELLRRKLAWSNLEMFVCNSGAEANEIALGDCFNRRKNLKAKKILALEGSFHGRLLVSLSATWNPKKREPFEIPGQEVLYVEPAVVTNGVISEVKTPEFWAELWEDSPSIRFEQMAEEFLAKNSDQGPLLAAEMKALLACREALASNSIFAVITEPMQCEGGDRYLSARFNQALLLLSRAFDVPLIYDEVQTGFGLGGQFFWHRMFNLQDGNGQPIYPDYVTCAKKAQVGLVLSRNKIAWQENFSIASLARGYIQAAILDQYQSRITDLEQSCSELLRDLCQKHSHLIEGPRNLGLAFSFDFKDKSNLEQFIKIRFAHGMLYYSAGSHTARFRMSLAWRKASLKFVFEKLDLILSEIGGQPSAEFLEYSAHKISTKSQYEFHTNFIKLQRRILLGTQLKQEAKNIENVLDDVAAHYLGDNAKNISIEFLDQSNYQQHRLAIIELEKAAYEPSRRTAIEVFDAAIEMEGGVALVICSAGKMAGIAFAAPLISCAKHRGVRQDPNFQDPSSVYMLDLTVHPEFQGMSLGRILKYGFSLLSLQRGVRNIQGRNRDHLAKGMFAINLGLGAYELLHLEEEYLDDEEFRDAIYYTIPVAWQDPALQMSAAVQTPMAISSLSEEFIDQNLSAMVNKISLGNFVNERYLENLSSFAQELPEQLRHSYVASGQSEAVDKIFKALWLKNKPRHKLLTYEGMYFGEGSFLSRSLSGSGEEFFELDRLPLPDSANWQTVLQQTEEVLKRGKTLAIFLEPMVQQSMQPLPKEFLLELRKLATKTSSVLVFNDTGSLFNRFSKNYFLASADPEISPDAGFSFLGGQIAVCYLTTELYNNDPLKLISTWDGDELSLATFVQELKVHQTEFSKRMELREQFAELMDQRFKDCKIDDYFFSGGFGWFRGHLPSSLSIYFRRILDYQLIAPSDGEIARFLDRQGV